MAEAYLSEHILSEEWRGEYLGVWWIIKRRERPTGLAQFNPTWNFYLIINEKQVPEGSWSRYWLEPTEVNDWGRVSYPYSDSLLGELDWHGGITYYRKHGRDGEAEVVEVGSDYAHSWDLASGLSSLTFEGILRDVKRCIESLREREPGLLWRCRYNGQYYLEAEGELLPSGAFLSHEGAKREAQWAEGEN